MNAVVASGVSAAEIASEFDTATLCLSKGLGCPLGALIAGSHDLMHRARIEKHRFGGAMRQAGMVAAAGVYALDHNVDRLADDHARARRLAEGSGIDPATVETNFVPIPDEPGLRDRLFERGVGVGGLRPGWLRAVTHLDVGDDDIEQAIERIQEVLSVHA
jgi:threonine aldolase